MDYTNFIHELEYGTQAHPSTTVSRRAADLIKQLIPVANADRQWRLQNQEMRIIEPSLEEVRTKYGEVISQENDYN